MILGAAVAAAALTLAATAAAASLGGFGARPAHFDPAVPATRAYFIRSLAPGRRFQDQVIVFNDGAKALPVWVYPVDGLTGATSGVVYGNRQTQLRGAGRWVRLATHRLTVPAHGQVRVPFAVVAPSGAAPGVHLAGIAVEQAHPQTSGGRFSVTEVLRTVVGVELDVPGPAPAGVAVRGIAPASPTQPAGLVVDLSNTGRRLCKPDLAVTLIGPGGAQHLMHRLDTVLPGDTIPYPVAVQRALPPGTYTTTATASACGHPSTLHRRMLVGHRISVPGDAASAAPASAPADPLHWWPVALVGAVGVGLGAGLSRGRRRTRPQH